MQEYRNWKWKVTKIGITGEHSEELTYEQVTKLLLSGGVMTMLKRMAIGEEIFYNEKNLKFQRIS
jgi:hypothetical protein